MFAIEYTGLAKTTGPIKQQKLKTQKRRFSLLSNATKEKYIKRKPVASLGIPMPVPDPVPAESHQRSNCKQYQGTYRSWETIAPRAWHPQLRPSCQAHRQPANKACTTCKLRTYFVDVDKLGGRTVGSSVFIKGLRLAEKKVFALA